MIVAGEHAEVRRVTIQTSWNEEIELVAVCYGPWIAVHRTMGRMGREWSVTHIPTGCAVAVGIGFRRARMVASVALATRTGDLDVLHPSEAEARMNGDAIKAARGYAGSDPEMSWTRSPKYRDDWP